MTGPSEPGDHVVDGVAHRLQVLEVLVVDPEAHAALAQLLLENSYSNLEALDGVSGLLSPGPARQFVREPVPVQFVQGVARPIDSVNLR